MKRWKHTLSHYRMITGEMGEILPLSCMEVLPGDTFQHHISALVRCAPLNTPVMHPVNVRVHHWYVPMRLCNSNWEDFITGETDIPAITVINSEADKKSLTHTLLGAPPVDGIPLNGNAIAGFNLIVNEWYRDQDLTIERPATETSPARIAWEKDMLTTARPWTQKGDDVQVPIAGEAPVKGLGKLTQQFTDIDQEVFETGGTGSVTYDTAATISGTGGLEFGHRVEEDPDNPGFPNIRADLAAVTGVDINDVRKAFAIQRWQEARARYGSRFTEYLRYLGVRSSDARLQRPELLGGGSVRLNFSEVLQTSQEAGGQPEDRDTVGDLFGHGIAGFSGNRYRKFFEEHGYIISVMSVRPKTMYMDAVDRGFLQHARQDRMNWFQKELQYIGQQEVLQNEVKAESGQPTDVFGYQDRYHEYKRIQSKALGDFYDELNTWHLGRSLPSNVSLNDDFVRCNPSQRIFQVPSRDVLWVMANNHVVARRIVDKSNKSRIL